MSSARPWIIRLIASASLVAVAHAGDYYVDAVSGNNANAGTSPAQAWRTVTHSLAQIPSGGAHVLHVAAGLYDTQGGEVFPLQMRPRVMLSGAQASSRPVLSGLGANVPVVVSFHAATTDFGPDSGLEHLDVSGGGDGVRMVTFGGELTSRIHDVSIERFKDTGLLVTSGAQPGTCAPDLSRIRIKLGGVLAASLKVTGDESAPGAPRPDVVARDCNFVGSRGAGVELYGSVRVRLERCRVEAHEMSGVWLFGGNRPSALEIVDSLVAGNGGEGIKLHQTTSSPHVWLTLERSTIAGNGVGGVVEQVFGVPSWSDMRVEISECVLANSDGDVDIQASSAVVLVRDSLVRDGQFDGSNGNFSLDPQFRAPAIGDFRLRLGSPCIDRVAANDMLDLRGRVRAIDGNLDTLAGGDLGAFEFETLALSSSLGLGDVLRLDVAGAAGSIANVQWARTGLVAAQPTLFGAFELDPLRARLFTTLSAPGQVMRTIPNEPLLVGHTFSFQALVDSAAAPFGRAFSNGVEVTVRP